MKSLPAVFIALLLWGCAAAPQTVLLLPPAALLDPVPPPQPPKTPASQEAIAVFIVKLAEWGDLGWQRIYALRRWRAEAEE